MCGIFGILARNARVPVDVLERGTASLAHRGPDDSGTVILSDAEAGRAEIGLGNRRLAILDLSPLGHQPMQDAANGNWIVYNGEIYNFRDLRKELEQSGDTFAGGSDTEVLLKAYGRWGERCLEKLRGMFAFAIWDARRHRLFMARDPMGIKPLYYAQSGSYFLFASEVRTLLGTGLVPRRIDRVGLVNYLTFGSGYDPLTMVEGIRALPAGHTLAWHCGQLQERSYWDLIDDRESPADETIAAEQLRPLLEDAVRQQLVSDVPVGVFLSGGIDSSALVSIVSGSGVSPSTFSIVFREADYSEAEHSRAVAREFRTDHHEITVSHDDLLAAIPDALGAMDVPTMDGVNIYFVSREARAGGVKVALSGLGGDEIFAGYSNFRSVPRMEGWQSFLNHVPGATRSLLGSGFRALASASDQNRKLESLFRDNGRLLHPYFLARMLFGPAERDRLCPLVDESIVERAIASQRQVLEHTRQLDPINRVSYLEARCYMLNTLLRDADVMSMSQGLELRVPLIDDRLAKYVLSLPGPWKLNGSKPKKLLVDALQRKLPEQIVRRAKRGFTFPFERWLRAELRSEIEPILTERIATGPLGGLMSKTETVRVWRDFLQGSTSWSRPWSLFVLHRWCELNCLSA